MASATKKSLKKSLKKAEKKVSKSKTSKKIEKKALKKKSPKKDEKKEEPTVVVLFFAHWCGHCQAMYPEWEQLRKEYENNDNFILKEIEHADIEHDKPHLEKEYDISPIEVRGFPTLVKFHPHEEVEYYEGGERSTAMFSNWLNNATTKDISLDLLKFRYGGYKIPIVDKAKLYSKNKTASKRTKSRSTLKK